MGQGDANFSYFVSGIALMGTVSSLVTYSRSYLPKSQMNRLDNVLQETRKIYTKSAAEELLPDALRIQYLDRLLHYFYSGWRNHKKLAGNRRIARTLIGQYKALFAGLTKEILMVHDRADELRAQVVTTSEKNKRRREGTASDDVTITDFPCEPIEMMVTNETEHLSVQTPGIIHQDDQFSISNLAEKLQRYGKPHSRKAASRPWYFSTIRKQLSPGLARLRELPLPRDVESNSRISLDTLTIIANDHQLRKRITEQHDYCALSYASITKPTPTYSKNRSSHTETRIQPTGSLSSEELEHNETCT